MSDIPPLTRPEILQHSKDIVSEYSQQGLDITVRQLYYQFVSRGLLGSGQKVYSRVVSTLAKARLRGEFPLDAVVDRARTVHHGDFTKANDDFDHAVQLSGAYMRGIPHWVISYAKWYGQPVHVSVWVEKEALAGVFESPCNDLGVGWWACKGYPSHAALYDWLCGVSQAMNRQLRTKEGDIHRGSAKRAVVLYFGDHDPDGWQIPRSAEDVVNNFAEQRGWGFDIEFKRVALNMDQIEEYDPPPFWAKPTSARYQSYVDEHSTTDAWELDALDPPVLDRLIRDAVAEYWDQDIANENEQRAEELRAELIERIRDISWLEEVFE